MPNEPDNKLHAWDWRSWQKHCLHFPSGRPRSAHCADNKAACQRERRPQNGIVHKERASILCSPSIPIRQNGLWRSERKREREIERGRNHWDLGFGGETKVGQPHSFTHLCIKSIESSLFPPSLTNRSRLRSISL